MEKISKSKIEKRLRSKTNPYLVKAIIYLKKVNPQLAKFLAMPKKRNINLNLEEIDKKVKDGEKVIFPGKILASGNLDKKIKIIAWDASEKAIEKMKKGKIEFLKLYGELNDLKKLNEYKIIT